MVHTSSSCGHGLSVVHAGGFAVVVRLYVVHTSSSSGHGLSVVYQLLCGVVFGRLILVSTPSGGRAPCGGSRTLSRRKTSAKFQ